MVTSTDVLPWPYLMFFTGVEPALTAGGVIYSVFSPLDYHKALVPLAVASEPVEGHPASIMAVRQLGSCFFLLALLASIFLRKTYSTLAAHPSLLEPLIHSYLWCLAVADLTHIGFTLYDLGLHAALHPLSHWNTLVCGNVVITTGLFVVRMLWFAGIGRATTVDGKVAKRA